MGHIARSACWLPLLIALVTTTNPAALQIGFQHGQAARKLILESVEFYESFFKHWAKLSWAEAAEAAVKFLPFLEKHVPHLVEEMQGLDKQKGPCVIMTRRFSSC